MALWRQDTVCLDAPQQSTSCDCGVFVCAFAEAECRGTSTEARQVRDEKVEWDLMKAQADVGDLRVRITLDLHACRLTPLG